MDKLKAKFLENSLRRKDQIKNILIEHGDKVIDQVTVSQCIGGMRGIKCMLWMGSNLDISKGILFWGNTLSELKQKLPKWEGCTELLPEGLFWLLLTGEIPTNQDVAWLSNEWEKRAKIPEHTYKVIDALPMTMHPMLQFNTGILSMQTDSVFASKFAEGMNKNEYWDATYEDVMNLIARLPIVSAYIYRRLYHGGDFIAPATHLDWAGNFAHMLGFDDKVFRSMMRMYLTIHADHEGGNGSAHATHLAGSTLSDPYIAFASGMNALAGPLHGLANQEVTKFILKMIKELGTDKPSSDQIKSYLRSILDKGRVIPGYGHAVLRIPDPRFIAQKEFAEIYLNNDPLIQIVWKLWEIVPGILDELGKVKNPHPNVDAHSGAILTSLGMKEYEFYTILFGVSRALGVLAQLCWDRALGLPLERPKSVTLKWLRNAVLQ